MRCDACPHANQMAACRDAVTETSLLRSRGMADIDARVAKVWLDAATTALDKNAVSFAMLPIRHLLTADNYLSKLRAQGYAVESPDEQESGDAAVEPVAAVSDANAQRYSLNHDEHEEGH